MEGPTTIELWSTRPRLEQLVRSRPQHYTIRYLIPCAQCLTIPGTFLPLKYNYHHDLMFNMFTRIIVYISCSCTDRQFTLHIYSLVWNKTHLNSSKVLHIVVMRVIVKYLKFLNFSLLACFTVLVYSISLFNGYKVIYFFFNLSIFKSFSIKKYVY